MVVFVYYSLPLGVEAAGRALEGRTGQDMLLIFEESFLRSLTVGVVQSSR